MSKHVYFARVGDYIKVGCTGDVPGRVRTLGFRSTAGRIICPADLPPKSRPADLIAAVPGDFSTETEARNALKALGAHACGEWFHLTPAVMSEIARMRDAWGQAA